jgi:hypothetical protein
VAEGDAAPAEDRRDGARERAVVDLMPSEPPPPSVELARGLSIYLPLDDGMGARLGDASGLNQMVRLSGADPATSWTQGRFGSALELRGGAMGGYLIVDSSFSLLAARTDISVAAWILVSADSTDGVIASQRSTGTGGYLYSLRMVKSRLNCLLNSASGYHADLTSPTPLPKDAWVHLAMTFDSQVLRLYVNGKPAGTADYLLALPPDPSPILYGGAELENPQARVSEVVGRIAARLDELALYDRTLPPAEVAQLAAGVRPRVMPPPR